MKCNRQARQDGDRLLPRTCPVCRLGPCTHILPDPLNDLSLNDLSMIDRMSDYRAREIAKAVDDGNETTVEKWTNMKVPEFLARCRSEFGKG